MSNIRTLYVCVDEDCPIKATYNGYSIPKVGDLFEFREKIVEVMDVHHGRGGWQLQVTKLI